MNQALARRLPTILLELGKLLGRDLDPRALLSRIAELVCQLVDADACSIMLLNGKRDRLMAKGSHGLRPERMRALSFAVGEGVAGWVAETGEAALIDDVRIDSRFVARAGSQTPIASLCCVPLVARSERVGVLTVTSETRMGFGPEVLELLQFVSTTIALDLENVRLHRVSVTDNLTGAYNREHLATAGPAALEDALRKDRAVTVALVDIDHFKRINDDFGHGVGDLVLAECAHRLRTAIRAGDTLIRYGGEEFLILLPRASAVRGQAIGERIRERCSATPIEPGDAAPVTLTVSVGIAEWRAHPEPEALADLIARADSALYAAKAGGRNRVEVAA